MKTKIAIFTKAEYSKEMNDIVASLKADERFDVFEIEDGKNIPSDCKNLIVFGGDGTVLEAVKNIREDVVVTGVNTGNLGFLTQFEKILRQAKLQTESSKAKSNKEQFSMCDSMIFASMR